MKLCLSIGVSQTEGHTDLPGAILAANEMGQWARGSGYSTIVITDEGGKVVTIDLIRKALLELLSVKDAIEHFVLHFAGHGIRDAAENNCWLPGDWKAELRVISVEGLKGKLNRYGIQSLSIFSDACRVINTDRESLDLTYDHVLPRGPFHETYPILDRFNAARNNGEAFMIFGAGTIPSRCVFTTVLIDGLNGFDPNAFDTVDTNRVIPSSLAKYTKEKTEELAKVYDIACSSDCQPGNPGDHVTFFRKDGSPTGMSKPIWPPAGSNFIAPAEIDRAVLVSAPGNMKRVRTFDRYYPSFFDGSSSVAGIARHLNSANLFLTGLNAVQIWTALPASLSSMRVSSDGRNFQVDTDHVSGTQILIQYEDGIFVSAVVYPYLKTVVSRHRRGAVGWTCFSEWEGNPRLAIQDSFRTMSILQNNGFRAEEADNLAGHLRERKHVDPTLGAISSYLYNYTNDLHSIRKTAFYYARHEQGMPFDIALMGQLPLITGPDKIYKRVAVPATPERSSGAVEHAPPWVTRSTPETAGFVAGLWPFLRQGWQFNDLPELSGLEPKQLEIITKSLLPSQFSAFSDKGAALLIETFNMKANR